MVTVLAKAEQQVLLAGLTKNHPIKGQALLQSFELPNLLAVREQRNAALHPGGTILEDPIRDEIGVPIGLPLGRDMEKGLPRIAALMHVNNETIGGYFMKSGVGFLFAWLMGVPFSLLLLLWIFGVGR